MEQFHTKELCRKNRFCISTLQLFQKIIDNSTLFFGCFYTFLTGRGQREKFRINKVEELAGISVDIKVLLVLQRWRVLLDCHNRDLMQKHYTG